jgi:hypothetical protein
MGVVRVRQPLRGRGYGQRTSRFDSDRPGRAVAHGEAVALAWRGAQRQMSGAQGVSLLGNKLLIPWPISRRLPPER